MAKPSPEARHVVIGRQYRAPRFEVRDRSGNYAALMPAIDGAALQVQSGLLSSKSRSNTLGWLVYIAVSAAIVLALWRYA